MFNNLACLLFLLSLLQSPGASLTQNKEFWRREGRTSLPLKSAFNTLKVTHDNLLMSFTLHSYLSIKAMANFVSKTGYKRLQKLSVQIWAG